MEENKFPTYREMDEDLEIPGNNILVRDEQVDQNYVAGDLDPSPISRISVTSMSPRKNLLNRKKDSMPKEPIYESDVYKNTPVKQKDGTDVSTEFNLANSPKNDEALNQKLP